MICDESVALRHFDDNRHNEPRVPRAEAREGAEPKSLVSDVLEPCVRVPVQKHFIVIGQQDHEQNAVNDAQGKQNKRRSIQPRQATAGMQARRPYEKYNGACRDADDVLPCPDIDGEAWLESFGSILWVERKRTCGCG